MAGTLGRPDTGPDGPGERRDVPAPLALDLDVLVEAEGARRFDLGALRALARWILEREGTTGRWEIAVALVDDDRLRELHRRFMGLDTVTDVMTFPLGDDRPGGARGGDVIVSVDRAADQGPRHGLTAEAETRFLVAHGLLHLCGWDDLEPSRRDAMLSRQEELIAAFGYGSMGAAH